LNHSNFIITNRRHGPLLWDVLAQQPIKVLVAASLPASKWSGKVSSAVELLINQSVRCKLFPVVIGQSLSSSTLTASFFGGYSLKTLEESTC